MPLIAMGKAVVAPLATRVCAQIAGVKRIADLFCGIGTFALRMAEFAAVSAFDLDERALSALAKAACPAPLRPVALARRDLFRHPLTPHVEIIACFRRRASPPRRRRSVLG